MSELVKYAKAELRAAGMFDADADYDGEVATCVVSMMETFTSYGHSGGSAAQTLAVFNKLANFKPLTPLTGEDGEWNDVSDMNNGSPMWQNRRCSTVFKDGETAWDIDRVPGDMRAPITFPYTV